MSAKLIQIDGCCSWKTGDGRFQVDYWANANRPRRADGSDGGYGMYTITDRDAASSHWAKGNAFTSKAAAFAEVRRRASIRQYHATGVSADGPFSIDVPGDSPADAFVEVSLSVRGNTRVDTLTDTSGRDVLDDIDPNDPVL